jgi:hypothetical protein
MKPNGWILARDLDWRRWVPRSAALASVIALVVYGLVFYDGRSQTQRIVDCLHGAGYTAAVSQRPTEMNYPPDTFVIGSIPATTIINVYQPPGESPPWNVRVAIYQGTVDRWDRYDAPEPDLTAIANCLPI